MSIELKIPELGESIQEVQIGRWLKQEGESIEQDEDVVELETDKASMELPTPQAGVLAEILKDEGETVSIGQVIAHIDPEKTAHNEERKHSGESVGQKLGKSKEIDSTKARHNGEEGSGEESGTVAANENQEQPSEAEEPEDTSPHEDANSHPGTSVSLTPSARRALREHGLSADEVEATDDRLQRRDIKRYLKKNKTSHDDAPGEKESDAEPSAVTSDAKLEQIVPMSLIRRRIAQRLVEAQQHAALLTTFNEIDMSEVIALREEHRKPFQEEYGVKLGYMPFFIKAVVDALRNYPELNAKIRDHSIIYRNYYNIGVAVASDKGLVVPVIRFAERMSFAEIEETIDDFVSRANANDLELDELEGGTFTISNGGIYGSLLSTPIVNPPESGVLGMHAIQDRPIAHNGSVVIRPMMYVALTYDHRIVDGREAVSFLKRVKEAVEQPSRMLIEI